MKVINDSVTVMWLKHRDALYTPSHIAYKHLRAFEDRFRDDDKHDGIVTFIASNPKILLSVIPNYEDYRILRMYSYSEKAVACDVAYKLSKKQARAVEAGLSDFAGDVIADIDYINWPDSVNEDLGRCEASGYVFAQTYTKLSENVAPAAVQPPLGLDWKPNKSTAGDGTFEVNVTEGERDVKYVIHIWRALYTHIPDGKTIKDVNKLKFALDMANTLHSTTFLVDKLHVTRTHPDWDYSSTFDLDDIPTPPNGYYWEENITITGIHRDYSQGASNTEWRRPKTRAVEDVNNVWLQPKTEVMLMSPAQFGETFGGVLPPGMTGIDFSEGSVAMINWFGSLTYQTRNTRGDLSPELTWGKDTHLPLNRQQITTAILTFNQPEAETPAG